MSGACEMGTHPLESALHPLVDCALTSVSATLRRDTRGAKGRVKERNEGLDSGIMARGMESHAVRALDEMPVARASESVAQGLGNGGAGGAAVVQRVMLPSPCVGGVRRRSRARATGKCWGFWIGFGRRRGVCRRRRWRGDGEAPKPREGTLGSAAVEKAGSARGRSGRIIQKGKESA